MAYPCPKFSAGLEKKHTCIQRKYPRNNFLWHFELRFRFQSTSRIIMVLPWIELVWQCRWLDILRWNHELPRVHWRVKSNNRAAFKRILVLETWWYYQAGYMVQFGIICTIGSVIILSNNSRSHEPLGWLNQKTDGLVVQFPFVIYNKVFCKREIKVDRTKYIVTSKQGDLF